MEKVTIAKSNQPPRLSLYVQTCSTTWQKDFHHRSFRDKNRRCAWEQWSFLPTIVVSYSFPDMDTWERSGITSTGDSLLLNSCNWYTDRKTNSLYWNIPTSCRYSPTQGLLKALIQLPCLCTSWPLCTGFCPLQTDTAGPHSRGEAGLQQLSPFMQGTVQSPGCKTSGKAKTQDRCLLVKSSTNSILVQALSH